MNHMPDRDGCESAAAYTAERKAKEPWDQSIMHYITDTQAPFTACGIDPNEWRFGATVKSTSRWDWVSCQSCLASLDRIDRAAAGFLNEELPVPGYTWVPKTEFSTVMERLLQDFQRKVVELEEQRAIRRFRRSLPGIEVPHNMRHVYGTTREEQWPVVAAVAARNLDAPTEAPPPHWSKPGIPVWTIGGKDYYPGDIRPPIVAPYTIEGNTHTYQGGQCADLGFTEYSAGSNIPVYIHPAPEEYPLAELPNGVKVRQVTPGNGWGHIAIVESTPEYPAYEVRGMTRIESAAWDEAEGQEWVEQQAAELHPTVALAKFIAEHLATPADSMWPAGYVDADELARTVMDGTFDLVDLAQAIIQHLED